MKLKDDDILQVGDIVHWLSGGTSEIIGSEPLIGYKIADVIAKAYCVVKITRKSPRTSRKEYKRRIEKVLEYIAESTKELSRLSSLETRNIVKILQGEE